MFALCLFLCCLFIFSKLFLLISVAFYALSKSVVYFFILRHFLSILSVLCFIVGSIFFTRFISLSVASLVVQSKSRVARSLQRRCLTVSTSSAPPPLHLQWVTATRPLHSFLGFSHFLRQIFAKVVFSFTKNVHGGVNISYIVTLPNKIKLIRVTNVSGHILSKR